MAAQAPPVVLRARLLDPDVAAAKAAEVQLVDICLIFLFPFFLFLFFSYASIMAGSLTRAGGHFVSLYIT